jgi:hypothetical protein
MANETSTAAEGGANVRGRLDELDAMALRRVETPLRV